MGTRGHWQDRRPALCAPQATRNWKGTDEGRADANRLPCAERRPPTTSYSRPVDLSDASCEYPATGVLVAVSPSSWPHRQG